MRPSLTPRRWFSGWLYPAGVSATPPGLRMGDGVFETVRTYGGRPFELRTHLRRLRTGALSVGFLRLPPVAEFEREVIRRLSERLAREPLPGEWILRPSLFAEREGWAFSVGVEPLSSGAFVRPLRVGVAPYPHPGRWLVPPGAKEPVKWLARGPLAHALRHARQLGWDEALLRDPQGRVVEGTRSNLFALYNGRLWAPGPRSGALPGVTRALVVRWASRMGLPVLDAAPTLEDVREAEEVFLTSTLLEVAPVASLEGKPPRRWGAGGPWTTKFRRKYAALTHSNQT